MTYPTLNATGVTELFTYANTVSEGYFGVSIMLSVYFVVLIFLLMRGDFFLDSAVVAGWVSVMSGGFLYLLGLLTTPQYFILVAAMAIPLALIWFSRDKE